jgi:hypothetical protein
MSSETPPALSLEAVIALAQESLLRDGYHLPTLIAEGTQQSTVIQLERMASTFEARAQQMLLLGAMLAQQGELGVLHHVFFITEAWMSIGTPTSLPKHRPSKDPQRTEVLTVSQRVIRPPQTEIVVFEMQRDATGKLVRLEDLHPQLGSENARTAQSPLLEAFAIGFLGIAK